MKLTPLRTTYEIYSTLKVRRDTDRLMLEATEKDGSLDPGTVSTLHDEINFLTRVMAQIDIGAGYETEEEARADTANR
jgi:hypothetical protein